MLSFSNAAVHAVQGRMRGKDAPAVTVRTIDSLASKVVRECTNDELEAMSFDDRIRAATDFLMKEEWEDVEDLTISSWTRCKTWWGCEPISYLRCCTR